MWIILKMPFDSPILWCNYKVEVARRLITEGVSVRQVWIKTRCSTQKVTQWIKVNLQICSCQYVRIILSQTYNVSQLQCTSLVKKCYQKILYILSLASGRLENWKNLQELTNTLSSYVLVYNLVDIKLSIMTCREASRCKNNKFIHL